MPVAMYGKLVYSFVYSLQSTGTKLLQLPPFVCQKFSTGLQYVIHGLEGTPRPKAALL